MNPVLLPGSPQIVQASHCLPHMKGLIRSHGGSTAVGLAFMSEDTFKMSLFSNVKMLDDIFFLSSLNKSFLTWMKGHVGQDRSESLTGIRLYKDCLGSSLAIILERCLGKFKGKLISNLLVEAAHSFLSCPGPK